MSDGLNIQLDGSGVTAGAQEAVSALRELRAAVEALGKTSSSKIKADMTSALSPVFESVLRLGTAFDSLDGTLARAVSQMAATGRSGGSKIGNDLGMGIGDGVERGVAKARVAIGGLEQSGAKINISGPLTALDQVVAKYTEVSQQSGVIVTADLRRNLKAYQDDTAGFLQMQKLKIEAARTAAEQIAAANLLATGNASRALLNNLVPGGDSSSIVKGAKFGTLTAAGGVSEGTAELKKLEAATGEASKATQTLAEKNALLRAEQKAAAESARELHSAFRGVAAAAGGLFLTYGSLIPLVSAFAAASAVKGAVENFKDLEYHLQFTRALTQDYTLTLGEMRSQLVATAVAMGTGPVEAAKGLQALAQAGLTATEALQILPTVLALASVGEMEVAAAATAVTGALHAFNLSTESASRVSDTFAKAAAVSNTTVAGIAESMKQASTIAQEFKISIEDVGTILAALAKRNITGGAAGTAVRNMFNEILVPKGEGKKIAAQLKLDLFDPITFNVTQFFDSYLPDLRKKLAEYNSKSQETILHGLFNERGTKAIQALLGMSPEELTKLRADVTDNAGYAMKVFIEANNTIEGELRRLKATFNSSLAEGGSAVGDQLKTAMAGLRESAGSPEFQSTLRGLLKIIADLLGLLGSVGAVMLSPGGAGAALGLLLAGSTALRAGMLASTPVAQAFAASLVGVEVGAAGAAVAMSRLWATLAALGRFTLVTAAILGTVFALSKLYDALTQPSPTEKIAAEYKSLSDGSRQYVEQLQKEINAIKEKNVLQSGEFGAIAEVVKSNQLITDSNKRLYAAESLMRQGKGNAFAVEKLRNENAELKAQGDATQLRLVQAKELAKTLREMQEASNPKSTAVVGTKNFVAPDTGAASAMVAQQHRALTLLTQEQELQRKMAEASSTQEEKDLKRSYDQRLINFGEYEAKMGALLEKGDQRRIADFQADLDATKEQVKKVTDARAAATAAGSKVPALAADNDLREAELKMGQAQLKLDEASAAASERKANALTKALAPTIALTEAAAKETDTLAAKGRLELDTLDQDVKRLQAKQNLNRADEREAYLQEQLIKLTKVYEVEIAKLQDTLSKDLTPGGVLGNLDDPAKVAALNARIAAIVKLQAAEAGFKAAATPKILAASDYADLKKIDAFIDKEKWKSFGESIKGAFGEAGDALTKLVGVFEVYAKQQEKLGEMQKSLAADKSLSSEDRIKRETDLSKIQTRQQLGAYGDMATAASGFFDKQSSGYRILNGVAQAFHAAQLAMEVAEMVPKAINAILTQGEGDPLSAFPRMAAMAAIVAGLGVAVGMSGGGADVNVSADRQKAAGTGTVLGDANAKSESITNSLKALESSATLQTRYQSGMLAALTSIASGISGLANLVVRTTGLSGTYLGPTKLGSQGGDALFGRSSNNLKDQGIQFETQNLADIIKSGGSVVASAFADIETKTSSFFGLFTSKSTKTELRPLDSEITAQFTSVVQRMVATTKLAAAALGQSADAYQANIANVVVSLGSVSFKDLTGAQIQDELTNIFSALGDNIAKAAMPQLAAFQKVGEGMFDTIVRVASGVENAKLALAEFGVTAVAFTDLVNKQGDVAVEIFRQSVRAVDGANTGAILDSVSGTLKDVQAVYASVAAVRKLLNEVGNGATEVTLGLIGLAGGLDKLTTSLQSYYDNFFTDAEKRVNTAKGIQATLAAVGLTVGTDQILNTTRAQFRSIVEQFAAMGPAGEQSYLALLSVSGALAALTTSAGGVEAALLGDVTTAHDNLITAYQSEANALDATIKRFKDFSKSILDFRDELRLGTLSPLTPAEKYAEARATFLKTVADSKSSDPLVSAPAMQNLQKSSTDFLDASRAFFASSDQYTKDFATVQAALTSSAHSAASAASMAQNQLDALHTQIDLLGSVDKSALTIVDMLAALATAVNAAIAAGVDPGAGNLAILKAAGIPVGTPPAPVGAGTGTQPGSTAPATYGGFSKASIVDYVNMQLAAGDPLSVYNKAKEVGISLSTLDTLMSWAPMTAEDWAKSVGLPSFAKGGSFAGGMALVGENGPELAYMPPAHIYNSHDTGSLLGGSSEVVAQIQALRQEIVELREQNNAGHALNASETARGAKEVAGTVREVPERARNAKKLRERVKVT